ncbi:hypothetical protein SAMN05216387_1059 [Nitrosovibrio tenuis]|uniref:Uncharacterized protein n=1 Tax=Nitrosovibrio tenuis TaxID=1233 RepID=A0A1H7MBM3_9PROT|nr:hypothetical protein SAMN05216387_1059 [Nitrosovibrio tenuis]
MHDNDVPTVGTAAEVALLWQPDWRAGVIMPGAINSFCMNSRTSHAFLQVSLPVRQKFCLTFTSNPHSMRNCAMDQNEAGQLRTDTGFTNYLFAI